MQTSVYVNRSKGQSAASTRETQQRDFDTSECLLVPPLVRDLQRKVMVDGTAHRRGCLLVNRIDANRGDILHYRMI